MKTIKLIKEDMNRIENENSSIEFSGTLDDVRQYLKDNGLQFIRQSSFSGNVYYK